MHPRRCLGPASLIGLLAASALGAGPPDRPRPGDDLTFRPTVIVRAGLAQGSGTVIASRPGASLVLTAAHVVREGDPDGLAVELHRFNVGREATDPPEGWPLRRPAELVAADPVGDVAVLLVRLRSALPYVARLVPEGSEPRPGAVVTSVGVDGGDHLSGWRARVRESAWMSMGDDDHTPARAPRGARRPVGPPVPADLDGPERPFLVTTRGPLPGRSGGGLYDAAGRLVGVCVGRIEGGPTRGDGLFAAVESVRRLLRLHDLDALVARPGERGGG